MKGWLKRDTERAGPLKAKCMCEHINRSPMRPAASIRSTKTDRKCGKQAEKKIRWKKGTTRQPDKGAIWKKGGAGHVEGYHSNKELSSKINPSFLCPNWWNISEAARTNCHSGDSWQRVDSSPTFNNSAQRQKAQLAMHSSSQWHQQARSARGGRWLKSGGGGLATGLPPSSSEMVWKVSR